MCRLLAFVLLSLVCSPGAFAAAAPPSLKVGFLIYDKMNILDFTGPKEVIAAANGTSAFRGQPKPFETFTVAPVRREVVSADGVKISADFIFADAPKVDILIVPGAGMEDLPLTEDVTRWVARIATSVKLTMAVCTGALVLGKAGVLDGKEATTHHMAISDLKKLASKATVRADRRYVDAGPVLTTGGVSAGIDGTLHLVDRFVSREVAAGAAKFVMEYSWDPEAVVMQPLTMDNLTMAPPTKENSR